MTEATVHALPAQATGIIDRLEKIIDQLRGNELDTAGGYVVLTVNEHGRVHYLFDINERLHEVVGALAALQFDILNNTRECKHK